jgi:hypothetical protein
MTEPNTLQEYVEQGSHDMTSKACAQPDQSAIDTLDRFGLKPDWFRWTSRNQAEAEIDNEIVNITIWTSSIMVHDIGKFFAANDLAHGLKKAAQRIKAQRSVDAQPVVTIPLHKAALMTEYQARGYVLISVMQATFSESLLAVYAHQSHLPDNVASSPL